MKNKYKKCFEILELNENANFTDLKSSYRFLKKLYSKEQSTASSNAIEDFSNKRREEILKEIDDAYYKLKEYFLIIQKSATKKMPSISTKLNFSGKALKDLRTEMAISIKEISSYTNISKTYLRAIEQEDFGSLPPAVYTQGFVKAYAEFLGLPTEKVVKDYMTKFLKKHD